MTDGVGLYTAMIGAASQYELMRQQTQSQQAMNSYVQALGMVNSVPSREVEPWVFFTDLAFSDLKDFFTRRLNEKREREKMTEKRLRSIRRYRRFKEWLTR